MALPQRDYRVLEYTSSLCAVCRERIDAKIVERDGSVYLQKHCPRHGEQTVLREKHAGFFRERTRFDKPGTVSQTQTPIEKGCPWDCGLCPDHEQHTCIGIIEVTKECDLRCPACYASPHPNGMLDLERIERMMDFFKESESGQAEVLQISGGEPTLHPRILDILTMAMGKGFKYVMLNTNGVRIARDGDLAGALGALGPGFEVYLQFDGLTPETSMALRGADLTRVRMEAVKRLGGAGVATTLVTMVDKGVNEKEIGPILRLGMESPTVRGVNLQPVAFFREPAAQLGKGRVTLTDILEAIEDQMGGELTMSDFVPLPCDVERVALTFLYRSGKRFLPITRKVDIAKHLDRIRNTFAFHADEFVEKAGLGGPTECACAEGFLRAIRPLIPKRRGIATPEEKVRHFNTNVFRVSVSSFVDPEGFDLKSMQRECVHVITPDLKKIPFSAYNMFHREP